MKRSLIYVLVLAVMLTALGIWGINTGSKTATAADTVTYWLPYLTTDTSAPVYCMASNMAGVGSSSLAGSTGADDNVTAIQFTVMSNALGNASKVPNQVTVGTVASRSIAIRKSRLIAFSGQSITVDGTQVLDLSTSNDTGTGTLASYGGKLEFVASAAQGLPALPVIAATGAGVTRSSFNCTSMGLSCFQGTTTPKRNVVGYSCSDAGMYSPVGTNVAGIPGVYAY